MSLLSAPTPNRGLWPGGAPTSISHLPWMSHPGTRIYSLPARVCGASAAPSQGTTETIICQATNIGKRAETPKGRTPTSVKKPAIPAWQEPCSSPYFFLYSRGEGRKEENHSLVSVCRSCGGAAKRAGHFPVHGCGLGLGMPSRPGRGRKVSGIHQTSKIQDLVPSGRRQPSTPVDSLHACGGGAAAAMVIKWEASGNYFIYFRKDGEPQ